MHHAFLHLFQLRPRARHHAAAWDRCRVKQAGGAPVTNDCLMTVLTRTQWKSALCYRHRKRSNKTQPGRKKRLPLFIRRPKKEEEMSELTQKLIKGKNCGTTEPHNQDLMVLTKD
ncbi:unnamed protein product [Rangifer tarandus platyrhynchus]|uniref:Uncharacterized protein n=1 Tax=Rangifer tarandus platyrhynchus TaxID=3082113 RepID=A0AC59ZDM5_RANTA